MSLRGNLATRLRNTWHGTPWYGDPSDKILGGITAEEASKRLAPAAHTIHEIVLHMIAWTETVSARIRGAGATAPLHGDWPKPEGTSSEAWAAALADLENARTELLSEIENTHDEEIQIHVRDHMPPFKDTGISRAGTVSGLVDHDTYHLGQIAFIKRALRS